MNTIKQARQKMERACYLFYALLFLTSGTLVSCMADDYDEPDLKGGIPYGNFSITEEGLVSIAELKQMFAKELATDYRNGTSYRLCTQPLKIKGYVTANDIEGNIYNEVYIQDLNGDAISIAVAQGGMYSFLPVGAEILIDVQGLCVGNYGMHPEIGVPYTNASGYTYVSRMSRFLFNDHFKLTGFSNKLEPAEYDETTWDLNKHSGRLGTVKNVSFKYISAETTFANPEGGSGSVELSLNGVKNVVVYTSNYSDFAGKKVPQGKMNITGVFKRYNNKWEILIRSYSDVEEL